MKIIKPDDFVDPSTCEIKIVKQLAVWYLPVKAKSRDGWYPRIKDERAPDLIAKLLLCGAASVRSAGNKYGTSYDLFFPITNVNGAVAIGSYFKRKDGSIINFIIMNTDAVDFSELVKKELQGD